MFGISIALALRESFFARLAVLPMLAMLACACMDEAPAPVPRDDGNAIAAEATDVAVNPIPRNDNDIAASPTPEIAPNTQQLPPHTTDSSEKSSFTLDKELEDKIRKAISSLGHASMMADPGFVSLDERILRSTIIARATMKSVSPHARGHYTPVEYFPILHFTFDVHEYLKGNGSNVITATVVISCQNGRDCRPAAKQEAIDYASSWISDKSNRWWENRESIIFLTEDNLIKSETSGQSDSTMYKFIPWIEYRNPVYNYVFTYEPYFGGDEYSILSERNRVWLPATTASAGASGASESRFMLGEMPKDLYPEQGVSESSFDTDISLSDLKSRIKAVADLVKQGEDVEAYETCLRAKAKRERTPWTPYSLAFSIQSGLGAGTIIDSIITGGRQHYRIYFFSGANKSLFEIVLEDDNSNPYDNYHRTVKTRRPLVAGDYSVVYHQMPGILRACIGSPIESYTDTPTANWTIRATSPAGTLHEAFFDPVAIGAAVGADGDNGALTPAAFPAAGGADAEIRRIDWDADVVKVEIANPPASLADHHIDFIALDGSVALRLDFGDAAVADAGVVRTFSWGVCKQPWSAGDKLMLRISESPPGLAGATNDASCLGEIEPTQAPTPSAASTPESSTQATPAPASTATVAPVSQPTQTPAPTPR